MALADSLRLALFGEQADGAPEPGDGDPDVGRGAPFARDMFGSPEYKFTATQHLGNQKSRVSQIQNGKWVTITDYLSN